MGWSSVDSGGQVSRNRCQVCARKRLWWTSVDGLPTAWHSEGQAFELVDRGCSKLKVAAVTGVEIRLWLNYDHALGGRRLRDATPAPRSPNAANARAAAARATATRPNGAAVGPTAFSPAWPAQPSGSFLPLRS